MSKTKSAATVYVAKIWHSDFHFSRIFTSRGDAEKAIAEVENPGSDDPLDQG